MVQVLNRENELKNSIILKEIIILEELPMEEEEKFEESKEIKREKQPKKAILKLFEKLRYNTNYLKETKSIEDIKTRLNLRNHAVY